MSSFSERIKELEDEVVMLTARAELAEEDAAEAWGMFRIFYERVAKRAGEPDFASRRLKIAAQHAAAETRLSAGRAR